MLGDDRINMMIVGISVPATTILELGKNKDIKLYEIGTIP